MWSGATYQHARPFTSPRPNTYIYSHWLTFQSCTLYQVRQRGLVAHRIFPSAVMHPDRFCHLKGSVKQSSVGFRYFGLWHFVILGFCHFDILAFWHFGIWTFGHFYILACDAAKSALFRAQVGSGMPSSIRGTPFFTIFKNIIWVYGTIVVAGRPPTP